MRTLVGTVLAVCVSLPLVACGSDDTEADDSMEVQTPVGHVWAWQSLTGDDAIEVPSPALYTIEFTDDGMYRIKADCNTGGGQYSVEGGTLTVHPGPMTRAACGPASLGDRFVQLLGEVESFIVEDDVFTVNISGDRAMVFAPLPADAAHGGTETLAGSEWLVTRYNTGLQSVTSIVGDVELTLVFSADGTVAGSSGCNDFSGQYTVDGASLAVGTLAVTGRMCVDEAVMEQESRFVAALGNATTWQVVGNELELRNDDGALQVAGRR